MEIDFYSIGLVNVQVTAKLSNGKKFVCKGTKGYGCRPGWYTISDDEGIEVFHTKKNGRKIEGYSGDILIGTIHPNILNCGARITQGNHELKIRQKYSLGWPLLEAEAFEYEQSATGGKMKTSETNIEMPMILGFHLIHKKHQE